VVTGLRGRATAVQRHTEVSSGGTNGHASTTHVLNFRLEQPGRPPIPVQMKGAFLSGTIADGDEVVVHGEPRPGKVLKVKYVDNLTTGIPVDTRWPLWAKILAVPILVFVFGIFAVVGYELATATALADESRPGEEYRSLHWRADPRDGEPAGRKIGVFYEYGGYVCQYRFHRASARETEKSVTIKVLAHRREMREDEACIAVAGGGSTVVRLKKPLGDRELRHARTNDPGWPQ
jgi:hypothetical protein